MFNNPNMQNYPQGLGQQTMTDRIDAQISQLNQMKEQMKNQQPSINQTFQLAPTNNHTIRYANTIGDVEKETVFFIYISLYFYPASCRRAAGYNDTFTLLRRKRCRT